MQLLLHINQFFAHTNFNELFIAIIVIVCLLFWKVPVLNFATNQKNLLVCVVLFFLFVVIQYYKFNNELQLLVKVGFA
jgi:hypothetical protein